MLSLKYIYISIKVYKINYQNGNIYINYMFLSITYY